MIVIFGGTTEGRKAVAVCDEAGKPYFYSTKSEGQAIESAHAIMMNGALDEKDMLAFCEAQGIRLIVDAAHPFATKLHQTIFTVAQNRGIPVVRLERLYPERDADLLWFDSYRAAVDYLCDAGIEPLLALTGVNTIRALQPYWQNHPTWFRILDRPESRAIAEHEGFPTEHLLYFQPGEDETPLFEQLKPRAIITKESGDSGYFMKKIEAARKLGIPVLVVKRPSLPAAFITVYGENGLRKQIEGLCPDFFPLRTGYSSGTCATAAAKAALLTCLDVERQRVSISLPNGEQVELPIAATQIQGDEVTCSVIKEAGDDPDVTNGHEIRATVRLTNAHGSVRFLQGIGVGRVTLPGLGLEIGGQAINETPRRMIIQEVGVVMREYRHRFPPGEWPGVDVTISVPHGEEIAKKTFNPKLGIVGGISIIGTSGIVKPFSSEAFIASIRREMQVAQALGCTHMVINSGAKSERYVKQGYPDLPPQAFVHYGNFIGESIRIASELGFEKLSLGIMIGKAVKLAAGHLDTHSKKVVMDIGFLTNLATETGCPSETVDAIRSMTLARQLWTIIPDARHPFYTRLMACCYQVCQPLFSNGTLNILLINEQGELGG